jgi:hypothetical protein
MGTARPTRRNRWLLEGKTKVTLKNLENRKGTTSLKDRHEWSPTPQTMGSSSVLHLSFLVGFLHFGYTAARWQWRAKSPKLLFQS